MKAKLDPDSLAKIKPSVIDLAAAEDDLVQLGAIIRQIIYHCQAPEELIGFDRPGKRFHYTDIKHN